MKKFESITKQFIPYHDEQRVLFTVKNDILRKGNTKERNFPDLKPQVEIDGDVWDVFGVESFQLMNCIEGAIIGIWCYPKKVQ